MTASGENGSSCDAAAGPFARSVRVVTWSLRLFGLVDLLALIAVFMPEEWLDTGHGLCGLGEFPEGPLTVYLARSTSLLWAYHGALLLFLAGDVGQHRRVIEFVARATVVAGVLLVGIDVTSGIPWWWTLLEGPLFALSGIWLLYWLSHFVDPGGEVACKR